MSHDIFKLTAIKILIILLSFVKGKRSDTVDTKYVSLFLGKDYMKFLSYVTTN